MIGVEGADLRIVVALTTSDSEAYLGEQLESISRQTRLPDAVVVGDDFSTDGTREILDAFARRSPFPVTIMAHTERLGPIGNTGAVLEAAVDLGHVIAIADHDDVWRADKLAIVEEAFAAASPPILWFSDAQLIDRTGAPLRQRLFEMVHLEHGDREMLRSGGGLRRLLHGETVTNPTMVVDARLVAFALPFPQKTFLGRQAFQQDGWMAVLARLLGEIAVDNRPLIAYRRHDRSVSHLERLASGPVDNRPPRHADLEREQCRARLVAERVRRHDIGWDAERREELLTLDRFLTARVERAGLMTRLRAIGREVGAGSYRRFARGGRTALYDIVDSFRRVS